MVFDGPARAAGFSRTVEERNDWRDIGEGDAREHTLQNEKYTIRHLYPLILLLHNPRNPDTEMRITFAIYLFFSSTLLFCAQAGPGNVDLSFDPGTGPNVSVKCVAVQPDNKVLIGGSFSSVSGTTRKRVARLNINGSVDNSFDPALGPDRTVWAIAAQSDGKVLIGGEFATVNGTNHNCIARLNVDGSLDTNFIASTEANAAVYSIVVQPDGKVLVGGYFYSLNGIGRNSIGRLNEDGTLDTSFAPGSGTSGGANSQVNSVAVQPDGKVLLGGYFTLVNGVTRKYLARLGTNGVLDAGFNPGTNINASVSAVAALGDGKVIIGGAFTAVGDVSRNFIARLNSDGTLDGGFDPGPGPDLDVFSIAVQPDQKVVIGGLFFTVSGISHTGIARLSADGSLDTSFDPGVGANQQVLSVQLASDGSVLLGGDFSTINNVPRKRVARLLGNPRLSLVAAGSQAIISWPTNAPEFILQSTTNLATPVSWVDSSDVPGVSDSQFVLTNSISFGNVYYRLESH